MKTSSKLAVVMLTGVMLVAGSVAAQQAPPIVGTWMIVSLTLEQDGKKTDLFGPHPQALNVFTSDGHFMRVLTRSDLPKFASNKMGGGTPEENNAVAAGSIGYFGTYTCNNADNSCTLHIQGSTFPNWIGSDQKRFYTLSGDDKLQEAVSASPTGAGKVVAIWKRVR